MVSGINIGKNVGLGFVFASGTVGACLEGNIAGIPGLALSQELRPDPPTGSGVPAGQESMRVRVTTP